MLIDLFPRAHARFAALPLLGPQLDRFVRWLEAEAHRVRVGSRDSAVGDGDAMGVAGEVLQDLLGPAKGGLEYTTHSLLRS